MTVQLKELREKRAVILTNARSKLNEITDTTPAERAAEIEREFDAMTAEADAIDVKIERLQKLADLEARGARPGHRPPLDDINGDETDNRSTEELQAEYREAFAQYLRFGASSLTPEQRSAIRGGMQQVGLSAEGRAQGVGTSAAGGYTVPQNFSGEIDRSMALWGPMWDASIVRELNTATGNNMPWPTVDDTSQEGEDRAENAAATDNASGDVVFGGKTMDAYFIDTKIVRFSLELLTDSAFDMQALLDDLFGERLGRRGNRLLTVGTGVNQPNGILTASGLGKTAAAGGAFTCDELIDFQHSVDPAYRASPKCRWQMNDRTLGLVRKMKDGQGNYLWQMGDIRAGEPDMLLGKPYSINQAMPDIAVGAKPILFGDHSRYVVRKVNDFTVMTLRERFAEFFQVGMIGFKRFDGELLNDKAVKHFKMAAA